MKSSKRVRLVLSRDEAIVLHEFLANFSDTGKLRISDQAEERVLWNLGCALEARLAEPLREDWPAVLASARERVRDPK